ncbi:hypothetical protein K7X08_017733 [Anisodus acutangulus]|uniref:Uncharacterized protein n=1 Tax=Anisodus acutangulus TaxID=402998 RepID=A0A9Q1LX38_9SOLA|nr:hypothetical protein K7X08_017733 [Anisodus acutangulus]
MLFAPSTIATIVGIIIGVVSLLRELMIGNEAPLHVIHSSAYLLGNRDVGCNRSSGSEICGLAIMWDRHFGLVGSDPLYHFVLLLQYELPSAMTIDFDLGATDRRFSQLRFNSFPATSPARFLIR